MDVLGVGVVLTHHGLTIKTDGRVDLEELKKAIRPDTSLVSVMAVNNEIGG